MKWINDEEVKQFLGNGALTYPMSRIQQERYIESVSNEAHDQRTFAIETLSHHYIGALDLRNINWIDRHAGIGIVIGDKDYWGKGYGTDAMRVLLRIAFDKMNLHRVHLDVHAFNERAVACYKRLGFKQEGVMREYHYGKGRYHDTIMMGLLASEYRAAPK